jgi:superfamily II RNA helicase
MDDQLTFRGLALDRFQIEAVRHIDEGASVVVSAATGTGKTIIADYVIDKSFRKGKKVFYTSPIKALSNQKFSEFKAIYGESAVGILTGDVVINAQAPLLIMTTEIYRNMLLVRDPVVDDLSAVVFDEIHYLGDAERGTAWEEAVIFSPEHVRFLCLSATIPNARQFAGWIASIKRHEVRVVVERKRAVPLEHLFFDTRFGLSSLDEIKERKHLHQYPSYRELHRSRRRGPPQKPPRKLTHLDVLGALRHRGWLPCIYFCFSRRSTEEKASQIAERNQFLDAAQQTRIAAFLREQFGQLDESIRGLETSQRLAHCLERGVAFHHAGLLPKLKEIVEKVFAERLLVVLYATETFAVGINLPAKAVCFDSLDKYDGTQFRPLSSKEYFQLAGRAGRRGMDTVGYAISLVDPEFADLERIGRLTSDDKEPLQSQYKLSYNTILNLIANHTQQEREIILRSSFYTYQQAREHAERIVQQYEKKLALLRSLGYVEGDRLTARGEFARRIYSHELVITELFTSTLAEQFSDVDIMLVCAALEFEPRPQVAFAKKGAPRTRHLLELFAPYKQLSARFKKRGMHFIEPMLTRWYEGAPFIELLDLTTMPEGDIVRFFRRVIDVLQQVQHATAERELKERVQGIIARIDRDVVQVKL